MHITRYEPPQNPQGLSLEREYYAPSNRIDLAYASKLIVVFVEFVAACIVLYFFFMICSDIYKAYGNTLAGVCFRAILGLIAFIPIGAIICVLDKVSRKKADVDFDDDLESDCNPLDLQDLEQKTMYRIPRGVEKHSEEWEQYAVDIYDAMKQDLNKPYSKCGYLLNVLGNKGAAYEKVMRPILEKYGREL